MKKAQQPATQQDLFNILIEMLTKDLGKPGRSLKILVLEASPKREEYFKILQQLMPVSMKFIDKYYDIAIDENGDIIPDKEDAFKILGCKSVKLTSAEDFRAAEIKTYSLEDTEKAKSWPYAFKSWPHIYVYSIALDTIDNEPGIILELAECNNWKKKITVTIDTDIHDKFNKLSNKMAINKSKFIENKMKEFIKEMELFEKNKEKMKEFNSYVNELQKASN